MPRKYCLRAAVCLTACGLVLSAVSGCGSSNPKDQSSADPSAAMSASPSGSPAPKAQKLDNLDQIKVSDDTSAQPKVDGSWPVSAEQVLTKTIVQGKGAPITSTDIWVDVDYYGFNGKDGKSFDASWDHGKDVSFQLSGLVKGFAEGLQNATVGSRVLIAIPPEKGYGSQGMPAAGIGGDDTIFFVVDIRNIQLEAPQGKTVQALDNLPKVGIKDGVPSIDTSGVKPSAQPVAQDLITGDGPKLDQSSTLVSHSVCVTWDGEQFYNDYAGQPANDSLMGKTHSALFSALVGKTSGSRVLVTLPGDQAYPHGNGSRKPSIAANTPIACVVDMLFVASQPS